MRQSEIIHLHIKTNNIAALPAKFYPNQGDFSAWRSAFFGKDFRAADALAAEYLFNKGYISSPDWKKVEQVRTKLALTWHHNGDFSRLQLLLTAIHKANLHIGAKLIEFMHLISKEDWKKFIGRDVPRIYF